MGTFLTTKILQRMKIYIGSEIIYSSGKEKTSTAKVIEELPNSYIKLDNNEIIKRENVISSFDPTNREEKFGVFPFFNELV